jgi:hypothetical protein
MRITHGFYAQLLGNTSRQFRMHAGGTVIGPYQAPTQLIIPLIDPLDQRCARSYRALGRSRVCLSRKAILHQELGR